MSGIKSIIIILIVLLASAGHTLSQDKKMKFSKIKREDDIYSLIEKAKELSDSDPKKALDYLEQALSKSLQEGNKQGEALCYATLGEINYKQHLYSQSVDFYTKALNVYESIQDKVGGIDTRKNLGKSLEANGNYDKALEQYMLAMKDAELLKRSNDIIDLKYKIGDLYEKQGKDEDALRIYKEVLNLEQNRKNRSGIITANNKIGNIYLKLEKTNKAKEHYEVSQEIATEDKNEKKVVESYSNISNTLRKDKKFKEELHLRQKSVEVNTKLQDSTALANDYVEIGKIYLEQKNNEVAANYLKKGEELSAQTGDLEKQAEANLALSEVFKENQDYAEALTYYENYVKIKDSILNTKQKNLATLVNFNDEISLKQKKIELLETDMILLKEEKKVSQLIIYFLSAGFVILLGSSWFIYISSRKRRIANQVLALKSLRSQMNPHFIFNALNSVNNYISKNDERSANKYLSDFSKLMRTVMENSQHEFINLSTELNILQLYLSLEHSRFKEKFDYELVVSEDIRPDYIDIPPMVIQPYIENAVWHGLRYKEEKGLLKVIISLTGENALKVVVEDNGIGRKRSLELKTVNQKDKVSTGLKNTESRLKIINELYKTRMHVKVEDLDVQACSGTSVTIYITQTKKQAA